MNIEVDEARFVDQRFSVSNHHQSDCTNEVHEKSL